MDEPREVKPFQILPRDRRDRTAKDFSFVVTAADEPTPQRTASSPEAESPGPKDIAGAKYESEPEDSSSASTQPVQSPETAIIADGQSETRPVPTPPPNLPSQKTG